MKLVEAEVKNHMSLGIQDPPEETLSQRKGGSVVSVHRAVPVNSTLSSVEREDGFKPILDYRVKPCLKN